jgi:hypothetical protein
MHAGLTNHEAREIDPLLPSRGCSRSAALVLAHDPWPKAGRRRRVRIRNGIAAAGATG